MNSEQQKPVLPTFSEPEAMFLFLALTGVEVTSADELCALIERNFMQMQDSQVWPAFDTQDLLQRLAPLTPEQCRFLCLLVSQMNDLLEADVLRAARHVGLLRSDP